MASIFIQTRLPESDFRSFVWADSYDPDGNLLTLRKHDGNTIGYSYDALNRNIIKNIPGGTATDVYYGYDLL